MTPTNRKRSHPPVDPSPEPAFPDVFEWRRDSVRVDKVFNIENLVARDVGFVPDLFLNEQHLADIGDLDGLTSDAGQALTLDQGGQVDEFCAVEFVVEVEDGPARVFKLEPDVGRDVALVDLLSEFRGDLGRHAEDEVFLDCERFVRVRVEFAVPPDRVCRVHLLSAASCAAALAVTHADAEAVPASTAAIVVV